MKKNVEVKPVAKWNWMKVENLVKVVEDKLDEFNPSGFLGVLAIPNGGYIPAILVSKKLGFHGKIKPITDPCMREGKWIIVDEIADSGRTAKAVMDRFPNAIVVVLAVASKAKTALLNKKLVYGEDVGDTWIQFPWELNGEEKV